MNKYEMIVIGIGPAGEQAALKAASFGHKVALVENEESLEASSAFPSKPLSETAFVEFKRKATAAHYRYRKNTLFEQEAAQIKANLKKHGIDIYSGFASFKDPHTLVISGKKPQRLQGRYILISTGSYPFHPQNIPFDSKRVHDPDSILRIEELPSSICIAGAGVTGCEYTTIFSTLGTSVCLVNDKDKILPQIDRAISHEFLYQMKQDGVRIFLNTTVEKIDVPDDPNKPLNVKLDNGETLEVDFFLFAAGRRGKTRSLKGEKIGLAINERENVIVDATFRSNIDHIYAVGDVIGFSSLGSTSMDQGRLAVYHMLSKKNLNLLPLVFPFGIYTVPEISMVGLTEEEAQKQNFDYDTALAKYSETARSKLMGIDRGFLKFVFNRSDLTILGIHIIGPLATELIHYGVEMIENHKTLEYIAEDVFNYPSLHTLYKIAANAGINQMTY